MPLSAAYPSALDALANPTATTNRDDPGFELDEVISRAQDILEALEAKLGVGASLPAAGGGALRQTASGVSAWGQIAGTDIASATMLDTNFTTNTIHGNKIQTGTLDSTQLAANAASRVWYAVGATSSPAYASASFATIAEMSVTVTGIGGQMFALYSGTHYGSVDGTTFITELFADSASIGVGRQYVIQGVNRHFAASLIQPLGPVTGTHTYDIRQSISGGGGMVAYSVWRALIVVELRR